MRKSKEDAAASRRKILAVASKLYRERGFDGAGVAEIMAAAGMTHGGFYRHFQSKEALIGEAMSEAFVDRASPLAPADGVEGLDLLRHYVRLYLSDGHLDGPSDGCPVAAVGSEASHVGGDVNRVFEEGVELVIKRMAGALGDDDGQRAKALRIFATLVGSVVIARAVGVDSSVRSEVVEAVRLDSEIAPLAIARQAPSRGAKP